MAAIAAVAVGEPLKVANVTVRGAISRDLSDLKRSCVMDDLKEPGREGPGRPWHEIGAVGQAFANIKNGPRSGEMERGPSVLPCYS